MSETEWIDAATACALLGVRRQTLYAYASRAGLRVRPDTADVRRSLYHRLDVERLAARHQRPRDRASVAAGAMHWGDAILETSISDLRDGVLYFGTRPATECAAVMTLEEVTAHHLRLAGLALPEGNFALPSGASAVQRAMAHLVAEMAISPPLVQPVRAQTGKICGARTRAEIAAEGARLIAGVAAAMLGRNGTGPLHRRCAAAWGAEEAGAQALRRALVLLSDHDLNPSTFAVRVCASTGAGLAAALLAGLATLSGPKHGGASIAARALLRREMAGAEDAPEDLYAHGFGHPIYPEGDPRARYLLAQEPAEHPALRALARLSARLGTAPNIDGALAALAERHCWPEEAPFILFCLGRLSGWIAHAVEQAESGRILRPRARFRAAEDARDEAAETGQ